MRIVRLERVADDLGEIQPEVERPLFMTQRAMALVQLPLGKGVQVLIDAIGEQRLTLIEQVDAAIELARAGLGGAVSPTRDHADQPVLTREQREYL